MSKTVTLELPERVSAALSQASREANVPESEIVAAALDDYLFIRDFRRLREKMQSQTKKRLADDEVVEQVL
jgi:predicted transcriptional regulator